MVAWATCAHAATDNLECFSAKDLGYYPFGNHFLATVDLAPPPDLDIAAFGAQPGCVIRGKARQICIPVSRTENPPTALREIGPTQSLSDARVCYKLKCPGNPTASAPLVDQFNLSPYGKLRASLLCVPAKPAPIYQSCTESVTAPNCDGFTFQSNDACVDVGGTCETVNNGCGAHGAPPQCFGECPGGGTCVAIVGGDCTCDYETPPIPCGGSDAPLCDGACPGPAESCTDVGGTCTCVSRACGVLQDTPVCTGVCGFGEVCKDFQGTCRCCSNDNPCP
jgi:hypothetical protein